MNSFITELGLYMRRLYMRSRQPMLS